MSHFWTVLSASSREQNRREEKNDRKDLPFVPGQCEPHLRHDGVQDWDEVASRVQRDGIAGA